MDEVVVEEETDQVKVAVQAVGASPHTVVLENLSFHDHEREDVSESESPSS